MKTTRSLGVSSGFTLLELLIGIVIVALLAAVAFPSYTAHVRRGKIAAALGEVSAVRVRLEQYYQDNRNYGATGCGVAMPSSQGFTITCAWGSTSDSQSFLITATGQDAAGLGGYVYTVDQSDRHKTTRFDGADVSYACWVMKKGEAC
ncbi:prepilin-type N-terminal cleavage/methylation domain-containing protein [Ramlibacter sp. XY19]|uniref:type IV pilin protein n=1 Tax=Ramlibacter paludis TaxID=2908000 RepID=UPI0023DA92DD|nr:type IV pilin protein [Ramlibacter paludis]MCG2595093.1 prepilin-type N-terminal cleavage/methylation domain-containing protein [Ramlibacter paludis]